MANGTVKWFNRRRVTALSSRKTAQSDVFVHISAVERAGLAGLAEGQKVSFDLEQGPQGKTSAVNLKAR